MKNEENSSQQTQPKWPGIDLDPQNLGSMCRLMDTYGTSSSPFPGRNKLGEEIWISIFPEKITTRTHQRNGWIRLNTYWRDGTQEETFDGKWKSHEKTEKQQAR